MGANAVGRSWPKSCRPWLPRPGRSVQRLPGGHGMRRRRRRRRRRRLQAAGTAAAVPVSALAAAACLLWSSAIWGAGNLGAAARGRLRLPNFSKNNENPGHVEY